jgi:hypothetical protein
MLDDIWLQCLEKSIQLACQQDSWEFLICLPNKVFETENVKDRNPSILLTPINHLFTYTLLRANDGNQARANQSILQAAKLLPVA